MGLISGLVFLNCSIFYNLSKYARPKIFAPAHILAVLMLALTAISQFGMTPKMQQLRTEMKNIDKSAPKRRAAPGIQPAA